MRDNSLCLPAVLSQLTPDDAAPLCLACLQVLSVLTRQGYRGGEVDALLSLASAGDESHGLLSQLSQGDAASLLDTLTGVLAEVEDGAPEEAA